MLLSSSRLLIQHLVACSDSLWLVCLLTRGRWGDHSMVLSLYGEIHLPSLYASISLETLSVTLIKKVMTAPAVILTFIVWIWNRNWRGNDVNHYTCLFSETWSWSEELRIPSKVWSSMQAAFISDVLMEQECVMLAASSNTRFCSLASTEVSSAIWDGLGHWDVAGGYNAGPAGEWLTSEIDRGRLAMVSWSTSDDPRCLWMVNDSRLNILVHHSVSEVYEF